MVRRKINGEIHLHSCDLMKMTRFVWIFSSVSLLFVAVLHFAALLYLALLSFVKTNVRISAAKLRCTHSWRAEEKHIYIYIFFFLVKDATTFIRVLFLYVTSYLHQTTGIFLFSPLCPEKRFSTVERAGKFRARCFVCISPSFTGFFLLANATRDCLTPFQTRIFEPAPYDRPLLYLSHSLESRDATLIHFFFESFLAAYAFHSRPTARACLSFTNYFNSFDFANASVFLRFSTGKREGGRKGEKKKKKEGALDSNTPTATTLTTR